MGGAQFQARDMAGLEVCACSSYEDKEDNSVLKAAIEVFTKLKDLNCPLLEGLYITEPETIQELLCSPSKYRLDILEWMYTRVCPSWQNRFSSLKGNPVEMKIQEMVKLGHELMLCGLGDQELLKGRASAQKQLHFMDQLLDTAQSLTIEYSSCSSAQEHLQHLRKKNQALLGELFSSSHLRTLLNLKCTLRSLAMQSFLNELGRDWKRTRPSVELGEEEEEEEEVEVEKVLELDRQLQESADKLQALRSESCMQNKPGAAVNGDTTSILDKTLRLATSDFQQLIVAFLHVYDDELDEFCQHLSPYVHPCGPIAQAVYQTLTSRSQMLEVMMKLNNTSTKAVEMANQQQREHNCWSNNKFVMSLKSKNLLTTLTEDFLDHVQTKTNAEENKQTFLQIKNACQRVEKSVERVDNKMRQQTYENTKERDKMRTQSMPRPNPLWPPQNERMQNGGWRLPVKERAYGAEVGGDGSELKSLHLKSVSRQAATEKEELTRKYKLFNNGLHPGLE